MARKSLTFFFSFLAANSLFALNWNELWLNQDQRAYQDLQEGNAQTAAESFASKPWQGAAFYRNGDYENAAKALSSCDTPLCHYNRGNALALTKKYEEAIQEYETALAQDPNFQDAQFNLDLIKKLMEQQNQSDSDQNQENNQNNQDQKNSDKNQKPSSQKSENSSQDQSQNPSKPQENQEGEDSPNQEDRQETSQSSEEKEAEPAKSEQEKTEKQDQIKEKNQEKEKHSTASNEQTEQQQATEQWLRRIPDDPGDLLRQKFLRDHQRYKAHQENFNE